MNNAAAAMTGIKTDLNLLKRQFMRLQLTFFGGTAAVTLVIAALYVLGRLTGISPDDFTRDPASVVKAPFYVGFLSHLGVLLWAATTSICLFSSFLLFSLQPRNRRLGLFLLSAGLLSLMLTLDDLFLLHEKVFPKYLGLPEILVYAGYAGAAAFYLWAFRHRILTTDYLLLLLALLLFGFSTSMDRFLSFRSFETFVEDSSKFAGIVFWLIYYSRTAAFLIRAGTRNTGASRAVL